MVLSFLTWLSLLPPLSSTVADVELVTSGAEADPLPSPGDGAFSSLIPGLIEDLLTAAAPAFPPTAGEVEDKWETPSPPLPPPDPLAGSPDFLPAGRSLQSFFL